MLRNFRRVVILLFFTSLSAYMLASLGMIALFIAPFDIRVEPRWQPFQAESFINDWKLFIKDFIKDYASTHLPGLDDELSEADRAYGEYAADIEALSGFIQVRNSNISRKGAFRIASALKHYSVKYGVPFELAAAVAHTESRFDPEARSGYGALGLMQVVWRVHSALLRANGIYKEDMLAEPEYGAAAGCLLLSRYIKESVDTKTALGRYYGGDSDVYWSRISRSQNRYRRYLNNINKVN